MNIIYVPRRSLKAELLACFCLIAGVFRIERAIFADFK